VGSILYFVVLTLFGMYIIMSLFIAILLEEFASQEESGVSEDDQIQQVRCVCRVALWTSHCGVEWVRCSAVERSGVDG
jgi:hypothetical protein